MPQKRRKALDMSHYVEAQVNAKAYALEVLGKSPVPLPAAMPEAEFAAIMDYVLTQLALAHYAGWTAGVEA